MSLLVPLLALALADPRPAIVERLERGDEAGALAATRAALGEAPRSARLGLDYLEGDLLARAGRPEEARAAFLRALAATPDLAAQARARLAGLAAAAERWPEAARWALLALEDRPPSPVRRAAIAVLARTAAHGSGCAEVERAARLPLAATDLRPLALARGDCAARSERPREAILLWQALLAADSRDAVALEAALRLADSAAARSPLWRADLVGLAFYAHREFERALPLLEAALADPVAESPGRRFELGYAAARARFWLAETQAAAAFRELAWRAPDGERRAQALHQAGRAAELAGDFAAAERAWDEAARASPQGEWAGPSLLGLVRLAEAGGRASAVEAALGRLAALPAAGSQYARALLWLTSHDLAAGRTDRPADWLLRARRLREAPPSEVAYWEGRRLERLGRAGEAVTRLLEAFVAAPRGPFGQAAARRLAGTGLAPVAAETLVSLTRERQPERALALAEAARLPQAAALREALRRGLARRPRVSALLAAAPPAVSAWPLWKSAAEDAATRLLRLGLWAEGAAAVAREFPAEQPALALTAAQRLAESGRAPQGIALAEAVRAGAGSLPAELWPARLGEALYPLPYRQPILAAAERGVPPALLAALLREESRFEPGAFSAAAARGLAQFVQPTARRLAQAEGLPPPAAADLERPELAIRLAIAYLAELLARYADRDELAVAAYNAGERQVDRWRAQCTTNEPEEFLSKVTFRETRAYLERVLASRAAYAARLAAEPASAPPAGAEEALGAASPAPRTW